MVQIVYFQTFNHFEDDLFRAQPQAGHCGIGGPQAHFWVVDRAGRKIDEHVAVEIGASRGLDRAQARGAIDAEQDVALPDLFENHPRRNQFPVFIRAAQQVFETESMLFAGVDNRLHIHEIAVFIEHAQDLLRANSVAGLAYAPHRGEIVQRRFSIRHQQHFGLLRFLIR